MGRKKKGRTRKGVLLYDTSLYAQARYRPAGLLSLGATATLLHPQSLEELEEPEFFLMTHEREAIRKIGLALHQGKNVYALPVHNIEYHLPQEGTATLLFCMALRKVKYQIRAIPRFRLFEDDREMFLRFVKLAAVRNHDEADAHGKKWCSGAAWATVCRSFKEFISHPWQIEEPGRCFICSNLDLILSDIRKGKYDEQIENIRGRLVNIFRSIDRTIAHREYYSQLIDFPFGPGSD